MRWSFIYPEADCWNTDNESFPRSYQICLSCSNSVRRELLKKGGGILITYSHILWLSEDSFPGLSVVELVVVRSLGGFETFRPIEELPERWAQDCGCWLGGGSLLTYFFKLISCLSTAELQQTERSLYTTTGAYSSWDKPWIVPIIWLLRITRQHPPLVV